MQCSAGVSKRQGGREHMEDEYLIFDSFSHQVIDSERDAETVIRENSGTESYALFGIFDGHGSDRTYSTSSYY